MLQNTPDLNLTSDGKRLEIVYIMKYLGMYVDEHLLNIFPMSVKKHPRISCKAREFLDRKTSLILHKSLVIPYVDYCDAVYELANETDEESAISSKLRLYLAG